MERILGKTFESLNSMLNSSGILTYSRDKLTTKLIPWKIDLDAFIYMMKDADSKKTEESIVDSYVSQISKRLNEPGVSKAEIHEMIKICLACENLGYLTPFIYVHCLKLVEIGNLQEKQTGYTATAYFLHPHHELVILSINTFQKDLSSSNYAEVLLALKAICSLINVETVNHVLYLIIEKLQHEKSAVRKSAIMTLSHCLYLLDSESAYRMIVPKLEKALTDNDLEVVAASISALYKILPKLSDDFTYLIKNLINLQDQILLRRVPRSMVYCDIPAPWLQLDILKFLKYLCTKTEHFEQVMPILKKTLQQVCLQNNVANAISYQVIETATVMHLSAELVEMVLTTVMHLLKSKDINLKLTGIEAASMVVKNLNPTVTTVLREIIYDCLNFPDETLQYKTLELLYHLTNVSNVIAIVEKLTSFMSTTQNIHKKRELSLKVVLLSEKYMVNKDWFIEVCINTLVVAGEFLLPEDVYRVINYALQDEEFRQAAVNNCFAYFEKHECPQSPVIKMTVSVLNSSSQFEKLLPIFLKSDLDEDTWMWILTSLMETILKTKEVSSELRSMLSKMQMTPELSAQFLSILLRFLNLDFKDYNPEENMDPSLSFLDEFILSVERKTCYIPASLRQQDYLSVSAECFKPDEILNTSLAEDSIKSPSQQSASYSVFSSPSTSFQSLPLERDIRPMSTPKVSAWVDGGRQEVISKEQVTLNVSSPFNQDESKEEMSRLFAGVS